MCFISSKFKIMCIPQVIDQSLFSFLSISDGSKTASLSVPLTSDGRKSFALSLTGGPSDSRTVWGEMDIFRLRGSLCLSEKEERWSYESYGGKENSVYLYIRSIRASDLNTNF